MMNIQKKSLQHVSDTLKSFDTYTVYQALNAAIEESKIDNEVRLRIINKYQDAISEQMKKVSAAKDWIDTLIADVK